MAEEKISYQVIRSSRKTIAIQITADGRVLVRCPRFMSNALIRRFVDEKTPWIKKHLTQHSAQKMLPPFTQEELEELIRRAKCTIPQRVKHFADHMGITYGRITIRSQRSRWGSCSSRGNLNFNCLLMLVPTEVLDYVVVHELCHRKELNHSPAFWREVEQVLPDYKHRREWLKKEGTVLISRLPK